MRIDVLAANDPRQVAVAAPQRPLWTVGAILEAIAVRDVDGTLWLNIGNQRLPARIASGNVAGPMDGERIKLRVMRDSPVLALETVDEPNTPDITEEALLKFLPKQSSPTPLLANLSWLARNEGNRSQIPNAILNTLQHLWNELPEASDLTKPHVLQQALQNSGEFLEAQLAKQSSPATQNQVVQTDFKALLLALRNQLASVNPLRGSPAQPPGPLPSLRGSLQAMPAGPATLPALDTPADKLSEIKQQAEGALARINTTQLLNAQATQHGTAVMLIEVPVRNQDRAELLRFKFEQHSRGSSREQQGWSVEVAMDLGHNGTMHAHVDLQGSRLNIRLRSDSPSLVGELSQQLDTLKAALEQQGLKVDQLVCIHGNPVDDPAARLNHLLDFHA